MGKYKLPARPEPGFREPTLRSMASQPIARLGRSAAAVCVDDVTAAANLLPAVLSDRGKALPYPEFSE